MSTDDPVGSFDRLDPEMRESLIELIEARIEYFEAAAVLNRRTVVVLRDPTPDSETELEEFNAQYVAPPRTRVNQKVTELLREAVDLEKIENMLPMLLMSLSTAVDLQLLFYILNFEPDMMKKVAEKLSEFFRKGMDS